MTAATISAAGRFFRGALVAAPLFAVLILVVRPASAQRVEPGPEIEAAWAALGPARRGWVLDVSPAFPASWPPDGTLRRYALAWRHQPGIVDGVEVAEPWAQVETRPGSPARLTPLTPELRPLGIQGVRPMSAEELRVARSGAELETRLATPGDAESAALIRAFHCGWAHRQGVVARAILPRHPEFTAWLGCG